MDFVCFLCIQNAVIWTRQRKENDKAYIPFTGKPRSRYFDYQNLNVLPSAYMRKIVCFHKWTVATAGKSSAHFRNYRLPSEKLAWVLISWALKYGVRNSSKLLAPSVEQNIEARKTGWTHHISFSKQTTEKCRNRSLVLAGFGEMLKLVKGVPLSFMIYSPMVLPISRSVVNQYVFGIFTLPIYCKFNGKTLSCKQCILRLFSKFAYCQWET